MKGKQRCKILKELRQQIAARNDITLITSECRHQGDCPGTCPKCEAEVRYLERELEKRVRLGKAVALAGIAAGVALTSLGCGEPGTIGFGTNGITGDMAPPSENGGATLPGEDGGTSPDIPEDMGDMPVEENSETPSLTEEEFFFYGKDGEMLFDAVPAPSEVLALGDEQAVRFFASFSREELRRLWRSYHLSTEWGYERYAGDLLLFYSYEDAFTHAESPVGILTPENTTNGGNVLG